MSVFYVNFYSKAIGRNVPMVACIPFENPNCFENGGFKSLYLLHGLHGNESNWIQKTNIEELSAKYNIAVFMPAGENSFYLNNPKRMTNFSTYIGVELVEYTRKVFNLSTKREDTFIGGLSMGGYGATINGLKYPETFGGIIAFSSAFIIHDLKNIYPGMEQILSYDFCVDTFGPPESILGSDVDYEHQAKKLIQTKAKLPTLYISCGTEDYLIEQNRQFDKFLTEIGYPHSYIEAPGEHTWDYWREHIVTALDALIK